MGHSLGGGTAAILTYVLREQKELSTATCVAFAPGVSYNLVKFICSFGITCAEMFVGSFSFCEIGAYSVYLNLRNF